MSLEVKLSINECAHCPRFSYFKFDSAFFDIYFKICDEYHKFSFFRFDFMEHHVNRQKDQFNSYQELIADVIKILHSRQPKVDQEDCLIPKCQKLVKKLLKNETSDENLAGKSGDCSDSGNSCPGSNNFLEFFDRIKDFLPYDGQNPDLYHSFITEEMSHSKSRFGSNSTKFEPVAKNPCHPNTVVDCSTLVTDFKFIERLKVAYEILHYIFVFLIFR